MRDNKLKKLRKYLTIRTILSVWIIGLFIYTIVSSIISSMQISQFSGGYIYTYWDFLVHLLFIIGAILLALNRKLTDYISFAIFVFLIGGVFPTQAFECFREVHLSQCVKSITFVFLLLGSPLIYLTISLIKNIGK